MSDAGKGKPRSGGLTKRAARRFACGVIAKQILETACRLHDSEIAGLKAEIEAQKSVSKAGVREMANGIKQRDEIIEGLKAEIAREARCFYCCSCFQSMCLHPRTPCYHCADKEGKADRIAGLEAQVAALTKDRDQWQAIAGAAQKTARERATEIATLQRERDEAREQAAIHWECECAVREQLEKAKAALQLVATFLAADAPIIPGVRAKIRGAVQIALEEALSATPAAPEEPLTPAEMNACTDEVIRLGLAAARHAKPEEPKREPPICDCPSCVNSCACDTCEGETEGRSE